MTPTRDELLAAADKVVISNATGNPDLYRDAVAGPISMVRALAHQAQAEPVAPKRTHQFEVDPQSKEIAVARLRPPVGVVQPARHYIEALVDIPTGTQIYILPPSSDQPTADELQRRLADMCREYQALSVKADQTWNEAIAAAAHAIEGVMAKSRNSLFRSGMKISVDTVRNVARPSQAQEPGKPVAVSDLPFFPTMLRKMWRGDEVQAWIDDNIKPLVQERHFDHAMSCEHPVSGAVDEREEIEPSPEVMASLDKVLSRAQQAPADDLMVDLVPPATSRDRWMYEQGRRAERDPRSYATAQQSPAVSDTVRYCYECGRIGEVGSKARDCCPDGSHAIYVPRELAKQAQTGFFALLSQPAAAPVSEQTEWMRQKFHTKEQPQ
jgi:hypothetical protein